MSEKITRSDVEKKLDIIYDTKVSSEFGEKNPAKGFTKAVISVLRAFRRKRSDSSDNLKYFGLEQND